MVIEFLGFNHDADFAARLQQAMQSIDVINTKLDPRDDIVVYANQWQLAIVASEELNDQLDEAEVIIPEHINIDVASRWLTGPQSNYIRLVSHFFSAVICGLLTLAAIKFLRFEAQMGSTAFFKLPVWVPEIIIPVTFGLMTLRFAVRFLSELARIRRHDFKQEFKQKK